MIALKQKLKGYFMQIYQKEFHTTLSPELKQILNEERKKRGLEITSYLKNKAKKLNQYMSDCGLDACVVAVSGGLDSSVTLGIVSQASEMENSPIKKIMAVSIPCYTDGATNQSSANQKAIDVANHFNVELKTVEIGKPVQFFVEELERQTELPSDQWSRGQAVSYMRTSAIYTTTSLLTANGFRSIVVGTTNRDEGAYIGYFGKASDGMVDVQLISDIHKADLRLLSDHLSIPNNIISDSPTGDMYDGRLDEEVFGVPYDFVELYTYFLSKDHVEQDLFRINMTRASTKRNVLDEFKAMAINLENMHRYNGHKYLGASPAVHLDIFESRIEGGWQYNVYEKKSKACEQPTTGDHTNW